MKYIKCSAECQAHECIVSPHHTLSFVIIVVLLLLLQYLVPKHAIALYHIVLKLLIYVLGCSVGEN